MSEEITSKADSGQDESPPANPLAVWLRLQRSLAEKHNIALTTLSRDGAAIGSIENDNSICRSLRISSEFAPMCAADCGQAFSNAVAAGRPIEFRCHAGLQCFGIPVDLQDKQLVILGGRVFTSTSDYSTFLDRHSAHEAVATGECLKGVKFADSRGLREAAEVIEASASLHLRGKQSRGSSPVESTQASTICLMPSAR